MPASIKHLTDKKLNLTSLLARWKDGLYYTAAIVKCDKANKRCLVCFEDGSEVWINNKDVHLQLTLDQLSEDEDIVCCICDEGHSEPPNQIIICDVCQQGYHQKCHIPTVDSSTIDESEETSEHKDWFCATCIYILNQSDHAKPNTSAQSQVTPSLKAGTSGVQSQQHSSPNKTTIGPVKASVSQPVQKPAPYYPLSTQTRSSPLPSTAALASMTASSALVVGSSAGRTKQDLVNQCDKSLQKSNRLATGESESTVSPPVKHAVRKSGVNFAPPVKQSALPTATRSDIAHIASHIS